MTVFSHMSIQLRPGQRQEAMEVFRAHNVFTDCAAAIPGFIQAFLLADHADPDAVSVIAEWQTAQDFQDWTTHPTRDAQEQVLSRFLAAPPTTRLFERHL